MNEWSMAVLEDRCFKIANDSKAIKALKLPNKYFYEVFVIFTISMERWKYVLFIQYDYLQNFICCILLRVDFFTVFNQ